MFSIVSDYQNSVPPEDIVLSGRRNYAKYHRTWNVMNDESQNKSVKVSMCFATVQNNNCSRQTIIANHICKKRRGRGFDNEWEFPNISSVFTDIRLGKQFIRNEPIFNVLLDIKDNEVGNVTFLLNSLTQLANLDMSATEACRESGL